MERHHSVFWIALSLVVMLLSNRINLGTFHSPGPGFMPFLLGGALFVVSVCLYGSSLARGVGRSDLDKPELLKTSIKKLSIPVGSLFVYILILETVGYPISTCLLLISLFRSSGSKNWGSILVGSILIVLLTYFGFGLLGLRLPIGIAPWR